MFGRNHFEAPKKAESKEVAVPSHTNPEALEMLEEQVSATIESNPAMYAVLSPEDIAVITNHLAKEQAETGVPYTPEILSNSHETEGLEDEILAAVNARLVEKSGNNPDASHA